MDKTALAAQLVAKVRESIAVAEREMHAATEAARHREDAKTRRADARMAIEYAALAGAQCKRAQQARLVLASVETFHPSPTPPEAPIEIGSLVEIEDEDSGEGRTFLLAPAGAGIELTGPGGDGFFTVVTPSSPVGKATMGQQVGDSFDVTVDGETRSWEITWVA